MNELEKRAKEHKKKQKGLSPFTKPNAGNVEHNINTFNHMMGSDTASGEGGMAMGESRTSRVYQHLTSDKDWAIVSPYRGENTSVQNRINMSKLKSEVRKMGYGFIQMLSRWVEDGEDFDEESLLIPDMKKSEAISLGKRYNQSSVIVNDKNGCVEICTTPFESYKEGDVVRKFNLGNNSPMNIEDAEAIFSHQKSGPVSKPLKGGKPFHLSEVYEVIPPRPSYFQKGYRIEKIFESSIDESKGFINTKRALWGDPSGKIKTFAIISPENPVGILGAEEEKYKEMEAKYLSDPKSYNKDSLNQMKQELVDKAKNIKKTGDTGLRMGGFNYIPIKGKYGDSEHSLLIFNLPYADAENLARDYGQESFFYGKVSPNGSEISYYKTSNKCNTYKLIETSDVVSDETDANNYFSKFGVKFRINMAEFGDEVKPIYRYDEFEESMNEDRTFLSRANHRRECYSPVAVEPHQEYSDLTDKELSEWFGD
ncbi:MAG: DUF3293 domain-containing protein [Methanobrevibacter sp.]|nr:DUF3293 domain-containing protein [Methanobrevibacter sp.]